MSVESYLVQVVPVLACHEKCVAPLVVGDTVQHIVSLVVVAPDHLVIFKVLVLNSLQLTKVVPGGNAAIDTDLKNEILLENICINFTVHVFKLVDLRNWFTVFCHCDGACNLKSARFHKVKHVTTVRNQQLVFDVCHAPALTNLGRDRHLFDQLKVLSESEGFSLSVGEHYDVAGLGYLCNAFTKVLF